MSKRLRATPWFRTVEEENQARLKRRLYFNDYSFYSMARDALFTPYRIEVPDLMDSPYWFMLDLNHYYGK